MFQLPLSSWKRFQKRLKNLYTPSMPLVFQGLDCSSGPRNISYRRRVSAPYFSMMSSGLTTLYLDLDIFSMAEPQRYRPSSSVINSAFENCGCHFLKRSLSNSRPFTMRSEEHTSELQSLTNLVCRLLLATKK